MRAVDTNVVVRMLVRDDVRQAASADAFVAQGAWVSHLVLAEVTWVLTTVYDRTPQQIANAIDLLSTHEHLTLQEADVVSAALAHFRRVPALGFSDCLILEVARKAGHAPLGTFDRALARLPDAQRV
jgi:predicted nucleic-acid-binding protein